MAFIAGINPKKGEVDQHLDKRKCKDCPDDIYWKKGKPKNYKDCSGGQKDKDHVCVNRLNPGSTYYEYLSKKLLICNRCKSRYPGLFVDCPACFKLMCQACGVLRDWRYDAKVNGCKHCGCVYANFVTVSFLDPTTQKYVKCDPWDSVKKEPVKALGFDKAKALGLIH